VATQIEIQRKGTFWVTWPLVRSEELAIFLAFKLGEDYMQLGVSFSNDAQNISFFFRMTLNIFLFTISFNS